MSEDFEQMELLPVGEKRIDATLLTPHGKVIMHLRGSEEAIMWVNAALIDGSYRAFGGDPEKVVGRTPMWSDLDE